MSDKGLDVQAVFDGSNIKVDLVFLGAGAILHKIKEDVIGIKETTEGIRDEAQVWAEGTDGQVAELGGEKSAKGWTETTEGFKDDAEAASVIAVAAKDAAEAAQAEVEQAMSVGRICFISSTADYIEFIPISPATVTEATETIAGVDIDVLELEYLTD